MSGNDNSEQKEAPAKKKPYAAPKLRHLGSVRQLTLGSNGAITDACDGASLKGSRGC